MRVVSIATLLAFGTLSTSCRDYDELYREYATVAEAVAAGEQRRGWLPAWIPAGATNLHVQGDIDTNERWLRFSVGTDSADALKRQLAPVTASAVRVSRPSKAHWWFESLIEQQPSNDNGLYADLYRGTGSPIDSLAVLAFDRRSPTVYVWWMQPNQ